MSWQTDHSGFLAGIFPEAGPALLKLYGSAAENAGLLRTDFYTIRDLLDLSGYGHEESLQVVLLCMMLALDEGSLCVEASGKGLARRLTHIADEEAAGLAGAAAGALHDHGYPELMGRELGENKPIVLRQRGDRAFLYFHKYLKHELILEEQLKKRLETDIAAPPATPPLRKALDEVLTNQTLRLNGEQRLATSLALLRNFAIVSGGPGTGKTSIVLSLLRCLLRLGIPAERIALAAPTGRAAQRLTDAIHVGPATDGSPDALLKDLAASTLHQLLGYHPSRGTFRHHVENPLPADVIIVDEVSMVGVTLMSQLLQATDPATKVILLGDKDQLPSVEAGAVLAALVPSDVQPSYSPALRGQLAAVCAGLELPANDERQPLQDVLVVLEKNYRSQRTLQEAARAINRQDQGLVERLPRLEGPTPFAGLERKPGAWLLEQKDMAVAQWRQLLLHWLEQVYLGAAGGGDSYRALVETCVLPAASEIPAEQHQTLARMFALLNRARILTLIREGPWGCVGINDFLDNTLRIRIDRPARGRLFLGAPVLITRNDHTRRLYNGDVGLTLRTAAGGYRVVFPRGQGFVAFGAETLPGHELAFALTVHKSQGSEYDHVLLVLPPEGGRRLLTKELIYTGITRAKDVAIVCATKESLSTAIGRRVERESGLLGRPLEN